MQKRRLGQTNIDVSVIGLGTVKFGRNQGVKYPNSFTLPSMQELDLLLGEAYDCGINLLDTAPAYGDAQMRLGKLFGSARTRSRDQWILSTKVGETFINGQSYFDFSESVMRKSIESSLKQLATDYLDIVLIHSHGDDEYLIHEADVFATLSALKAEGKIRAFGMSTKTIAGGILAVEHADVVMVTYNPLYGDEVAVIKRAQQKRKGVLVKKAFASGHLHLPDEKDPYSFAIQFALKESGVSSVIVGTINGDHLRASVAAAAAPHPRPFETAASRPPQGER